MHYIYCIMYKLFYFYREYLEERNSNYLLGEGKVIFKDRNGIRQGVIISLEPAR